MTEAGKKTLVLLSTAILTGGIATTSWVVSRASSEQPMLERFLPADTIAFVEVSDLRALALRIARSDAWQQFARIHPTATSVFLVGANHSGILDASYALALVASRTADGRIFAEPVLVALFDSTEARRVFERRALELWSRDGQKRTLAPEERYGDAEVYILSGSSAPLSYARAGHLVVFARHRETAKRILDVSQGRAPSLESNPHFMQAGHTSHHKGSVSGFVDVAAAIRVIEELPAEDIAEARVLQDLVREAGADSVLSATMISSFEDGHVIERIHLRVPEGGRGLARRLLTTPPTPRTLLALVPEDATQVFDLSTATAAHAFADVLTLVAHANIPARGRGPQEILDDIRRKSGVDVQADLLSALGPEACLVELSDREKPERALLVTLQHEQRFARSLEKLASSVGRLRSSYTGDGHPLTTVLGRSDRAVVHYTFWDRTFIASNSPDAIEKIIETAQSGRSWATSIRYAEMMADLPGDSLFVFSRSNGDYLNRLARWVSGRRGDFPPTSQSVELKPSLAFGVAGPDGLTLEMRSPLGTIPRMVTSVLAWLSRETTADTGATNRR
jgi:hypothetical protein